MHAFSEQQIPAITMSRFLHAAIVNNEDFDAAGAWTCHTPHRLCSRDVAIPADQVQVINAPYAVLAIDEAALVQSTVRRGLLLRCHEFVLT